MAGSIKEPSVVYRKKDRIIGRRIELQERKARVNIITLHGNKKKERKME